MSIETIPKGQWHEFLDSFNRRHEGWLVTVASVPSGTVLIRNAPLGGISVEPDRVIVAAGPAGAHADHVIEHPTAIRMYRATDGADRGLEIDTPGACIYVRFRSPTRPELVDGLAHAEDPK